MLRLKVFVQTATTRIPELGNIGLDKFYYKSKTNQTLASRLTQDLQVLAKILLAHQSSWLVYRHYLIIKDTLGTTHSGFRPKPSRPMKLSFSYLVTFLFTKAL